MQKYTYADVEPWIHQEEGEEDRPRASCERLGGSFTLADILRAGWISPDARLRIVLSPHMLLGSGVLPDSALRLFAARVARRALERERAAGREPDQRSWTAVETAERYARGEATGGELAAVLAPATWAALAPAAEAASWAAATEAAPEAATWAAAEAAAWAAAWAATEAATWAPQAWAAQAAQWAVRAATTEAARDAERRKLVGDLLELLSKEGAR